MATCTTTKATETKIPVTVIASLIMNLTV